MSQYKSTSEILNNAWQQNPSVVSNIATHQWSNDRLISVEDVELWETIYYESGNVGVYAAYRPFADFYLIAFNQFLDKSKGIETYRSVSKTVARCREFGIHLEVFKHKK